MREASSSGVPAPTKLSVDGNIAATTFTSDGSTLTGIATQGALSFHEANASAHHAAYTDGDATAAVGGRRRRTRTATAVEYSLP